jgi:hypothetical protein
MFGSTNRRAEICERSTSWWNEVLETIRSSLIPFETTKQSIFLLSASSGSRFLEQADQRFMAIPKSVLLCVVSP